MADLGRGSPPLILDQTKTRRAEKISFWRNGPLLSKSLDDQPPAPHPPYLKVWIRYWKENMWPACTEGFSWQTREQ